MRVVVTGAGGFIGGVAARVLAEAGHEVIAVYRKTVPRSLASVRLQLVQADLRRIDPLPARYDALVHCAADVPAFCPDPDALYASNVEGTRSVLTHAGAAGASRIVYCSSMSVYGTISAPVADEKTPTLAADAYGRSKLAGERLLAEASSSWPVAALSLRLPGVVGAGSRNNFLSSTLARILADAPVVANHPDALFNNVLHVADLAGFMGYWVEHGTLGHRAVPIAARGAMRIRDVIALLYAASGRCERVTYSDGGKTPFTIATAAAESLGYRPLDVRDSIMAYVADELAARN